jgi:hypothetical protein
MLDIGNRAILRVLIKGIKSSDTPEEDLNELLTYIEKSFPDENNISILRSKLLNNKIDNKIIETRVQRFNRFFKQYLGKR